MGKQESGNSRSRRTGETPLFGATPTRAPRKNTETFSPEAGFSAKRETTPKSNTALNTNGAPRRAAAGSGQKRSVKTSRPVYAGTSPEKIREKVSENMPGKAHEAARQKAREKGQDRAYRSVSGRSGTETRPKTPGNYKKNSRKIDFSRRRGETGLEHFARLFLPAVIFLVLLGLLIWGGFALASWSIGAFQKEVKKTTQAINKPKDDAEIRPAPVACTAEQLGAQITHEGKYVNQQQVFWVRVTNHGFPCLIDSGKAHLTANITSGNWKVANTFDCSNDDSRRLLLANGDNVKLSVVWDGKTSNPDCKVEKKLIKPGTYNADIYFDSTRLNQDPISFSLQDPPAPAPQPADGNAGNNAENNGGK